jgi:hypothetical protein
VIWVHLGFADLDEDWHTREIIKFINAAFRDNLSARENIDAERKERMSPQQLHTYWPVCDMTGNKTCITARLR